MTVSKADIVQAVMDKTEFTKRHSAELVETVLEIMKRAMAAGEDVMISGFGKFSVKDKRERRGRNPATGEDMTLRARRVVAFRCSGKLREKINADGDLR